MIHWPDVLMITFKQINQEAYSQLEHIVDEVQTCLDKFDKKKNVVSKMFARKEELKFSDEIDRIFAQIWNRNIRIEPNLQNQQPFLFNSKQSQKEVYTVFE